MAADALSCPFASYLSGWSHGKETLKNGSYDTLKGSFYVNCAFYQGKGITVPSSVDFPEFTAPNVWPAETSLPGFRVIFEELCALIIDAAVLVARACDQYAVAHIEDYEPGYLEHVVKDSMTTKARLLHYFPPAASSTSSEATHAGLHPSASAALNHDSWCATHIDRKSSSLMYHIRRALDLGCETCFWSKTFPNMAFNPNLVKRNVPNLMLSRWLPNWIDVRRLRRRSGTPSSSSCV